MKLLTTSSADIIQECRVMFDVKSVSKSIFKRRRNVLPVVVTKMSNIRRIKSYLLMQSCTAMGRHFYSALLTNHASRHEDYSA